MGLIKVVLWAIGIILVMFNLFWYLMLNFFDNIIGDVISGMMLTIGMIAFLVFLVFAAAVRFIFWPWRKLKGK
jgi:hypothetical protein